MLGLRRHRWRTIEGGANTYVAALLERLRGQVHLGLGVRAVRRDDSGVEIVTEDGETRRFDKVVLATHADQSLALLADPSADERTAARRLAVHDERGRSPHRRAVPAPRLGRTGVLELPRERIEQADRHVLPEPAPAPRGGEALLPHPQPLGRDRSRDHAHAHRLHAPALHAREHGLAGRAADALRPATHGVRGRVPRLRIPRGRARIRCACGRGAGSRRGEIRSLRRLAHALAPGAEHATRSATASRISCSTWTSFRRSSVGSPWSPAIAGTSSRFAIATTWTATARR